MRETVPSDTGEETRMGLGGVPPLTRVSVRLRPVVALGAAALSRASSRVD